MLLLDEPTNYLDLESILWLEAFLRDYPGAVMMTCHDRDVMNRVVKKIVEIDGGAGPHLHRQLRLLRAGARRSRPSGARPSTQRQQAMLAKESRFIERFKAQAAKAPQVQSRIKKLEKIERIEPPRRLDREAASTSGRRRAPATTSIKVARVRKALRRARGPRRARPARCGAASAGR